MLCLPVCRGLTLLRPRGGFNFNAMVDRATLPRAKYATSAISRHGSSVKRFSFFGQINRLVNLNETRDLGLLSFVLQFHRIEFSRIFISPLIFPL